MSHAITKSEAKALFLQHLRDVAQYWDSQKMTSTEKLDGLAFSVLTLLDGSTMVLPAMDLVLRPHPEDKEYRQTRDENWFENGMAINDDAMLHEEWYGIKLHAERK